MSTPLIVIPGRRSDEAQGQRTPVVSCGRLYADAVQRVTIARLMREDFERDDEEALVLLLS
jgi:hypothetical protein